MGRLGQGEPRLRQPSREVYGRMDLAISAGDDRADAPSEPAAGEQGQRTHQARFQRPGENLPKAPAIDPAVDEDERAVYWRQERNGMWARAALISHIFGVDGLIPAGDKL